VAWGEMDAFQHLNNVVYFRYFEDARLAFFNQYNVLEFKESQNIGPILAATNCNFRIPLEYPDRIHISVRVRVLSPKKLAMEYVVYSETHDAVAAEGEGLIVFYDYAKGKSAEMPAPLLARMKALEA